MLAEIGTADVAVAAVLAQLEQKLEQTSYASELQVHTPRGSAADRHLLWNISHRDHFETIFDHQRSSEVLQR